MLNNLTPGLLSLIKDLTWYQYAGELIAILLAVSSILISINNNPKSRLWKNFLRSSSFLIAFSSIVIPWMIKGLF